MISAAMAIAATRRLTLDIELSHRHESLSLRPVTDLLSQPGGRTHNRRVRRYGNLVGSIAERPEAGHRTRR
jgi:hypothetical protein